MQRMFGENEDSREGVDKAQFDEIAALIQDGWSFEKDGFNHFEEDQNYHFILKKDDFTRKFATVMPYPKMLNTEGELKDLG